MLFISRKIEINFEKRKFYRNKFSIESNFVRIMIWYEIVKNCIFWNMHRILLNKRNCFTSCIVLNFDKFWRNVNIFEHANEHIAFDRMYQQTFCFYQTNMSIDIVMSLFEYIVFLKNVLNFIRCVNYNIDYKIRMMRHQKCITKIML